MSSSRKEQPAPDTAAKWLMLVHLLPATPSNVRVKTWRRLQSMGAVGLKNSVYVLPNSAQAREDFEWIKTEIIAMKGSANILVAETLDPAAEQEIVAAFQRAYVFAEFFRKTLQVPGRFFRRSCVSTAYPH